MNEKVLLGIDGGTEGIRVGVYTASGKELGYASAPYNTKFPSPGQAEQNPEDWWRSLCTALPKAIAKSGIRTESITALAVDTTCCTVCFLDNQYKPLRPALLWMDVRAEEEAASVLATKDNALAVNNAGHGPVSAEWMLPKALWVKKHEAHIYDNATTICEYQDYLNHRLTGVMCKSANNTGVRWHHNHNDGGIPESLLAATGAHDLAEKWPQISYYPGERIGGLAKDASDALGLPRGLSVVQGGADAFIAMAGMGVVRPGQLALVTGSSHLHLSVSDQPINGRGMWGAYANILRPGSYVVEGGQTSSGSVINWFRRTLAPESTYKQLDRDAADIPIGCDGVTAQDHFQGNRTPYTDASSRGAFTGLSLKHTRGHLYRAALEGVAYGTRLILETMAQNGVTVEVATACGGVTRSPFWTQLHADVIGTPIRITDTACAPALGSAIFAAIGAGIYDNLDDATEAMAHCAVTIDPDPTAHSAYAEPYERYRNHYKHLKSATDQCAYA